jgi:hypothetical protein
MGTPEGTAWAAAVMTYEEFVYYKPPLFRGRDSVLDMASFSHP